MAGGKETPRQKMIGMMYLVLTALLALNVSKSILDAFVTLDDKLQSTMFNFDKKNQNIYNNFSEAMSNPDQKKTAEYWNGIAMKIQKLTDSEYNYIDSLKNELIKSVEGVDWYPENEEEQWIDKNRKIRRLKPFIEINAKDNYDAPTAMMVGGNPEKPNGAGVELVKRFNDFRGNLTKLIGNVKKGGKQFIYDPANPSDYSKAHQDDTAKLTILRQNLTLPRRMFEPHTGDSVFWEAKMFDHAPVVAALAMFTSIQADIRNAEAEALEHIYSNVNANEYNFNKIEPIAFASKNYINQGDSVVVKIFMAAFDTIRDPKVTYTIDSSGSYKNARIRGGQGLLGITGEAPGAHSASGLITIETKSGPKSRPWYFPYEVGAPVAVISPYEMNVLYIGYNNKIQATASGYPPDRVKATCSGCSLRPDKGDGKYIAKVSKMGKPTITVSATDENGKSVVLGKMQFRALPLPTPLAFLGKKSSTDSKISRGELRIASALSAKLPNSPLNVKYTVTSFEMAVTVKGQPLKKRANGFRLTSDMKNILSQLKPGSNVAFRNIKAKGPAGGLKLSGLSFEVSR